MKGKWLVTQSFTATGATKFVPGPYKGQLVKIEKKYKVVETDGEREDRPYLRWIFEILEEGFEGKTLSLLSSTSFGVGPTGPSKGRRIAEAILGRELEIGETFTEDQLKSRQVTLHVDNEKTGRGTFARIVDFTPAPAEVTAGSADDASDSSLDDIDEAEMRAALG
jgi:hypothetical protein